MIKKSSVTRAVIVRSNNNRILSGGHIIRCDNKAIILLKENGDLLGTRILGLVSSSLRFFGFTKILSISNYIY